jgi:hypothetical protein
MFIIRLPLIRQRVTSEMESLFHSSPMPPECSQVYEQIPSNVVGKPERTLKAFRDKVCGHFGLRFNRIAGNGNCFFESMALVTSKPSSAKLNSFSVRQQLVAFLRSCSQNSYGMLGELCLLNMRHELNTSFISSGKKRLKTPTTIEEYLDGSSNDAVWVAGSHWMFAAAHLFSVRVCVIVHNNTAFVSYGNPSHSPVYLYKEDTLTHYSALVPVHPVHLTKSPQHGVASVVASTSESSGGAWAGFLTWQRCTTTTKKKIGDAAGQVKSRRSCARCEKQSH